MATPEQMLWFVGETSQLGVLWLISDDKSRPDVVARPVQAC